MTLRLSEIYTSVQGEGPNTGELVQFVRFGGCNLRCPGWPCDTAFAVDPKFHKDWDKVEPDVLPNLVADFPRRLCITGGEPLLQPASDLATAMHLLQKLGYAIDLFTNGTFPLPSWATCAATTVVMDWKLPGSGENLADAQRDTRWANCRKLDWGDAIKFVVKDEADLRSALAVSKALADKSIKASQWVGACWGSITDEQILAFSTQNEVPWKLNVQIHKYLWEPAERGV